MMKGPLVYDGKTMFNYEGDGSLRVFYSGSNLLTITNYSGLDPEFASGNPLALGVYNSNYPSSSVSAIGVNIKF